MGKLNCNQQKFRKSKPEASRGHSTNKRKFSQEKKHQNKKFKTDDNTVTLAFTNLPQDTNDSLLNDFVKNSGLKIKIKSCRANFQKRKAFVDFNTWEVKRALQLHNVEWNGGKICVCVDGELPVSSTQPKEETEPEPTPLKNFKLFCKNFPYNATAKEISDLFQDVEEVNIVYHKKTQQSRGFAYVHFNSKEALAAALSKNDSLHLRGRRIFIDECGEDNSEYSADTSPTKTLAMYGITEDINEELLLRHFKGATHARIVKKPGSDQLVAYVEFDSVDSATKLYEDEKGVADIENISVVLEYSKKMPARTTNFSEDQGRTVLFIKDIPEELNEKDLTNGFNRAVGSLILSHDEDNKRKRFGFVKFNSENEAEKIFRESKNGWDINGYKLKVNFATRKAQCRHLCVKGFPDEVDEGYLLSLFRGASFAHIAKGNSLAFIHFPSELDALKALHSNRGKLRVGENILTVFPSKNKKIKNSNRSNLKNVKKKFTIDNPESNEIE